MALSVKFPKVQRGGASKEALRQETVDTPPLKSSLWLKAVALIAEIRKNPENYINSAVLHGDGRWSREDNDWE